MVYSIQDDGEGHLWVHTNAGYSIYDVYTETFNADIQAYVERYGIHDKPDIAYVDDEKNIWIVVNNKGLFKIDAKTKKTSSVSNKNGLHNSNISNLLKSGNLLYINYNDGFMEALSVNSLHRRKQTDYIMKHKNSQTINYKTYIDNRGNIWVHSSDKTFVYDIDKKTWYDDPREYLTSLGYKIPFSDELTITDLTSDLQDNLWVATDGNGLLKFTHKDLKVQQFLYNKYDVTSIPNNNIQCLYTAPNGAVWIGMFKNGLAYHSPTYNRFSTIEIGDVCTITEDNNGILWCGSNDEGIVTYDIKTKNTRTINMQESGLGSNTIVSSLTGSDGSLWFGTYQGGMAHYKDGAWKVWRAEDGSGLLNDNVWYLCQMHDGRIAIGTLGSGIQILNPATGKFTNYNTKNSELSSDYINSVENMRDGRLLLAHSDGISILNPKNGDIKNIRGTKSGVQFVSMAVNQAIEDSRGLIWLATLSGVNAYNPANDSLYTVVTNAGMPGSLACSVAEDDKHNIWVVNEGSVTVVKVKDDKSKLNYFTTTYNSLDGLQERVFNYRAIRKLSNGFVVVGGQDGINLIPQGSFGNEVNDAKVLFSGLMLNDHIMKVGEEYNDRVVLNDNINESRVLKLKHDENTFSILLASSEITVPQESRFRYRLVGLSDEWKITARDQNIATFAGLSPGHYTLEVQVVNRDGVISKNIARLDITISQPFYLSMWAILFYIVVFLAGIRLWQRYTIKRQAEKFKVQQYQNEVKQTREMEEMKLNFFTNLSHELRTPLMLIISPIQSLLNNEEDPKKHKTLEMIYRNAQRLLEMVGQIMEFRKMEKSKQSLNLISGDIIGYIRNITSSFKSFEGKNMKLEFRSPAESLNMVFDREKIREIFDNLLSNAMKYSNEDAHVIVSIEIRPKQKPSAEDLLLVRVADNGIGISDEDKKHIFERFYMANKMNTPFGGSGIGLSIAHEYALLHGGDITVSDNKGGGSVFTVELPIRHEASLIPTSAKELEVNKAEQFTTETPTEKAMEDVSKLNPELKKGKQKVVEAPLTTDKEEEPTSDDTKEEEPAKENVKEKPVNDDEKKKKRPVILLVDDSTDFLDFMKNELGQHYEIRTAENGRQALDSISEQKPDLILSDVMMPIMDGNELCKAVKGNKHTADIPFIMLTARLAQEHQVEGLQNGADEYITKPFNLKILYMRIDNLLKWRNNVPDKKNGKLKAELKHIEVTSLDKQLVEKATKYVDDNISDSKINVESMAKELGMSRVQLYKRLLPLTGSTPTEFIREIRLRRAEQLLRESQMSVSEVAFSVGFNNPRYFSKYFKEMYGVMPSQYKK